MKGEGEKGGDEVIRTNESHMYRWDSKPNKTCVRELCQKKPFPVLLERFSAFSLASFSIPLILVQ